MPLRVHGTFQSRVPVSQEPAAVPLHVTRYRHLRMQDASRPLCGDRNGRATARTRAVCVRCDLTHSVKTATLGLLYWGRTGFDLSGAPEAACRGRCVGLVNPRIKTQVLTKN